MEEITTTGVTGHRHRLQGREIERGSIKGDSALVLLPIETGDIRLHRLSGREEMMGMMEGGGVLEAVVVVVDLDLMIEGETVICFV